MCCFNVLKCFYCFFYDILGWVVGKYFGIFLFENYDDVIDIIVVINSIKIVIKYCV